MKLQRKLWVFTVITTIITGNIIPHVLASDVVQSGSTDSEEFSASYIHGQLQIQFNVCTDLSYLRSLLPEAAFFDYDYDERIKYTDSPQEFLGVPVKNAVLMYSTKLFTRLPSGSILPHTAGAWARITLENPNRKTVLEAVDILKANPYIKSVIPIRYSDGTRYGDVGAVTVDFKPGVSKESISEDMFEGVSIEKITDSDDSPFGDHLYRVDFYLDNPTRENILNAVPIMESHPDVMRVSEYAINTFTVVIPLSFILPEPPDPSFNETDLNDEEIINTAYEDLQEPYTVAETTPQQNALPSTNSFITAILKSIISILPQILSAFKGVNNLS